MKIRRGNAAVDDSDFYLKADIGIAPPPLFFLCSSIDISPETAYTTHNPVTQTSARRMLTDETISKRRILLLLLSLYVSA